MSSKAQPGQNCPNCHSRDVWRWHREGSLMKKLAPLLSMSLMTCRGCGNTFYQKGASKLRASRSRA